MAGLIQVLTYVICFYLFMKGVEIFQLALTSNRQGRIVPIVIGILAIIACTYVAIYTALTQDNQVDQLSRALNFPNFSKP